MDNSFKASLSQRHFELMKSRLLLRLLDEVPNPEAHPLLIAEAHVSAALADATAFPLLLFPCLFEERAGVALERASRQVQGYWRGLDAAPQRTDRSPATPAGEAGPGWYLMRLRERYTQRNRTWCEGAPLCPRCGVALA